MKRSIQNEETLQVRLPLALMKAVQRAAIEDCTTTSAWVRKTLVAHLKNAGVNFVESAIKDS